MAFSARLGDQGITPEAIETEAVIDFEGGVLKSSTLHTTVRVPGADEAKVKEAAAAAKEGCPISKVLRLEIGLELTVVTD